jgi:predicted AlkP superfamily phosphohydrolase/phosphomutase
MVWDILGEDGHTAGAFNVPSMYPTVVADGAFLLSGGPIGGDDWGAPPSRRDHLKSVVPRFYDHKPSLNDPPAELVDNVKSKTELVTKYATTVLTEESPEFFMTVYKGTDTLGHYFWVDHDPTHPNHDPGTEWEETLRDYYRFVDDHLASLLDAASEETNVIILSDHGMGPAEGSFALNQWLVDEGYLVIDDGDMSESPSQSATSGLTKDRVRSLIRHLPFADQLEQLAPTSVTDRIPEENPMILDLDIDWEETTAYSSRQGQIYVCADDESAIVDEMAARLSELADTHELSLTLHRREDTYTGEFADRAPHLTVGLDATRIRHRIGYDSVYTEGVNNRKRNGIHRSDGLYFAAGPDFESVDGEPASVTDITPTVLHAMGVPLSKVMEGTPLSSLSTANSPEYVTRERNLSRRAISQEEQEAVAERLDDLGYL